MRHETRGWIMPEADMLVMLRLLDEKIRSTGIETRHRDALIRLRDIIENDLDEQPASDQANKEPLNKEQAA